MHDIKWIRDNPDAFDRALMRRNAEFKGTAQRLIALDEKRRQAITDFEQAQARRNAASKEIGEAKKNKDEARANALMAEVAELKGKLPQLDQASKDFDAELNKSLAEIPNLPLDEVPEGKDEHGNVEKRKVGEPKKIGGAKQHFELGEALGQMDFETAAKLSGARFVVLKNGLARLERALGQFMLDMHTQEHGYTEINPPILVRDDTMFGTAQLPKFEEDQFPTFGSGTPITLLQFFVKSAEDGRQDEFFFRSGGGGVGLTEQGKQEFKKFLPSADRLWLIPTAEVPLTNLVREAITDESELPMRVTALTPCFRAEAGAAGRDTRGMIRQHQFTKVELVSVTTPETSMDEHERMTNCAEAVLKKLELPFRTMTLCTGDMGFASQKTYDIEVWLPGQNMYREISSCSVCGEFQARRMNARFRGKDNKPRYVHTLNGSGVAVGRALIAVMENYQDEGGAIAVPAALQPYMGGMKKIEKVK